ncbi:MAG: phosphate acyltransferase PlsX [Chloroflexi bacterium]|nr:phosphate acyltransferase PlsX [Chloroflexota bacterium]
MRIALDAMGSDTHPKPEVEGAVMAARESADTIILVGDEAVLKPELLKHEPSDLHVEIVHAAEVVTMNDKPTLVGKAKPNSSMHVGLGLVKAGEADAFVTAGNTGAALSIATLNTLRRIEGVRRPALTAVFRLHDRMVIVLDVGANTDAKPQWLAQFALMGSIYANGSLGIARPRVALLSNGEEDDKGTQLIRDAAALIRQLPLEFVGSSEPKDFLDGYADVLVMEGFVGNIFIKTMEAMGSTISSIIRQEAYRDLRSKLGGWLLVPALSRVQKQIDPFEVGGAPLLGIDGVVIIGHGRSNAKAIKNAIGQARRAVDGQVIDAIRQGIARTALTDTV